MTSGIDTSVVIVGAGFGGVAMAVELRRSGIDDFVVLEQADNLGGVWRENTYPGAGCDVPSPLYSFSFARNVRWPRRYAGQADIHAYLARTAREYGVTGHIRFGSEVAEAEFDADTGTWDVRTSAGTLWRTRAVVPATGQLSRPALPALSGIDSFRGRSFHSAQWDHSVELAGKRVAVIGTGASAVQFVPEIQRRVSRLTVFQRSAPHIMPKRDHAYQRGIHRLLGRVPLLQSLDRLGFWLYTEFAQQALSKWLWLTPVFRLQADKHLRESVADSALRETLRPDYQLGCKRILFSNDYLPAMAAGNVEVVTEQITEVTPQGVRTADGTEHEVDVVIYGTGFATLELLAPMKITGIAGRPLSAQWSEGARAYLGITVPGFPNMFLMYGPNTNLGGGSIVYMLESQARYIRRGLRHVLGTRGGSAEVRAEAEARWDAEVQHRLERSVWTRCQSWYRNAYGRVVSNWPGRTHEYRRRTRRFDAENYYFHSGQKGSP